MNVSQALDEIRAFIESDPLTKAAASLSVPASTRQVLTDHLLAVEADVAAVVQSATAGLEPPAVQ